MFYVKSLYVRTHVIDVIVDFARVRYGLFNVSRPKKISSKKMTTVNKYGFTKLF